MNQDNANIASLEMEISIAATPEAVWTSLTENIGQWWPEDFYAGGEAGKRKYALEARPGGRMYEEWENGGGALWGTVITADPARKLQVCGALFPEWGGPSQWYGTWDLTQSGDGTVLRYSESAIGRVSDAGTADKDKGWRFLWGCLKAHVENGDPPVWQD